MVTFLSRSLLCGALLLTATPILAQTPAPTVSPSAQTGLEESAPEALTPEALTPEALTPEALAPEALAPDGEIVVVVSDTRTVTAVRDSPASVSLVSGARLEIERPFDLAAPLERVPGLTIAQSGSFGRSASLFLRGTNSNHSLVLIDGVRANSASDGRFDWGTIAPLNIERVEVVRGPISALYGSDALGGVVNIVTRRGDGEFASTGALEFGTSGLRRQEATGGGEIGRTRVSFGASRREFDGFFENDDFRDTALSLRLDREIGARQELSLALRSGDSRFGVPGQRFLGPDPFQRGESRDRSAALSWSNRVGNRLDRVTLGTTTRDLRDDDRQDPNFPAPQVSRFDTGVRSLEAQSSWRLGGEHLLTAGFEDRRQNARVLSSSAFGDAVYDGAKTTRALFVQDQWRRGALTLVPGVRFENDSQFGSFTSVRLAGRYDFGPDLALRASYGTAFKAPTFDALLFPGFSNPDLTPERSRGLEIGALGRWGRADVFVTAFSNRLTDLIQFSPQTFRPENLAGARSRGIEAGFEAPLVPGLSLEANATWLSARADSGPLLRRPGLAASASLVGRSGPWSGALTAVARGSRFDSDFVTEFAPVRYPGWARLDLTLGYRLAAGPEVFARVGNLLDRSYEEVAGFPSPGRTLSLGLRSPRF